MSTALITILFFGDIVGKPGRRVLRRYLAKLDSKPDLIVANVENAAAGFGVTETILNDLKTAGVQIFSGGNHTFDRKEIFGFIDREPNVLRPANYPAGTAGGALRCGAELRDQCRISQHSRSHFYGTASLTVFGGGRNCGKAS